jgi:hypothetical protein
MPESGREEIGDVLKGVLDGNSAPLAFLLYRHEIFGSR